MAISSFMTKSVGMFVWVVRHDSDQYRSETTVIGASLWRLYE